MIGDAAAQQRSWEQVLKYRRPEAILIDEAQHFAKTAGGTRLENQLDHAKSLAIATKTIHILAGTYDLLLFRNLNAQLSRRSIDVHFPRYEATKPEERKAFQRALLTFQRHLPLEKAPNLMQQWEICYAHTVGCIGLLKDWLTKALAEALETEAKTISPSLLAAHAPSVDRCNQMITDIEEGEKALRADPEATERLRGYREEIRQIALLLQTEQVALTQRHIGRYLMQPAILRDPKVRELLREVCYEVEEAEIEPGTKRRNA